MSDPVLPEPTAPLVETPRAALAFSWGMALLLFALFATLGAFAQLLHVPFGIWFTELFLFLGFTWIALRLTGRHPLYYPGLGVPPPSALLLGLLAGVLNFFALVIPLQVLSQTAFEAAGLGELLELFRGSKIFERQRAGDLAVIIAGVTLAAPLCEEYFFRGVLLRGSLSSGMRTATALLLTSVFFSAFHLDPVGFFARAELGWLFGYLYLRTGSLWPAILAHAANNGVSSALFFIAGGTEAAAAASGDPELWTLPLLVLTFGAPLYLTLRWFQSREPVIQTGTVFIRGEVRPRELGVWLGGAALGFALLLAVDRRTVALNLADLAVPAREPTKEEVALKPAFDALEQTREAVRRGELPLEQYKAERRAFAEQARGATPPVPPPPPETTVPSE